MRRGPWGAGAGAALLLLAAAGCGTESAGVTTAPPAPPTRASRAELLASCPARAPEWQDRYPSPSNTDDPAFLRRQADLDRGAVVAERYLARLPADQSGELRLSFQDRAIVVQVTRDAATVRRELQVLLGDTVRAEVETVRFSKAELDRASATIRAIRGLDWSGVGMAGNGRVEVWVPDAARIPADRALIAKSVDPCIFRVTQGDRPVPLVRLATP